VSPEPEIAVVVGAYARTEFLRSAVRSLLGQTLARDRFEIVVTKNFRDAPLDAELSAAGAQVLFDEEPQIGRWLRRAVRATRAPWVTFLDDDDEYDPGRLARLLEVVGRYPALGLYRNRVTVIDRTGGPIPSERWRRHETDAGFDTLGPVYVPPDGKADLFELATQRSFATFNSSTMAIRRDLLEGPLGDAFEGTRIPDTFLFLIGAIAPAGLFLDDRRLTRFRYYGASVTSEVRWYGHATVSEAEMARVADRYHEPRWAAWFRELSVHHDRMLRGGTLMERIAAGAGRSEVGRLAREYFRYLGDHPGERRPTVDTWAAGLYGLGYVVAPGTVRSVARARITAGRE